MPSAVIASRSLNCCSCSCAIAVFLKTFVLATNLVRRIDVQRPAGRVQDQRRAGLNVTGYAGDTDKRRDAERFGDDDGVAVRVGRFQDKA